MASQKDQDNEDDDDDDDGDDDDDSRGDLLLRDACLREFAGDVVDGLYTSIRRKLQNADADEVDHNYNCNDMIANADDEIRSHVR